jgi:hypothetical protein
MTFITSWVMAICSPVIWLCSWLFDAFCHLAICIFDRSRKDHP